MTFEADEIVQMTQAAPVARDASSVSFPFDDVLDPHVRDQVIQALPNPVLASWREGEMFFRQPLSQGYFAVVPNANQIVLYLFTT